MRAPALDPTAQADYLQIHVTAEQGGVFHGQDMAQRKYALRRLG